MEETKKAKIVDVVDVRREGRTLILPESLSYDRAIDILTRQKAYEEQTIDISADFDALPQEGGVALVRVLKREFGFALAQAQQTMMGKRNPRSIEVQTGVNETEAVPWGEFVVPGITGTFTTDATVNERGLVVFAIRASVLRKDEPIVKDLVAKIREEIRQNSIYKGKAWRYRMRDDDGDLLPMATPTFMELDPEVEHLLTFPEDVEAAIQTNLWVFIERTGAMRKIGNPLKRGVIFVGTYGVGKTMTANVTAIKAVRHGWTYIVVDRATELPEVARVARRYGPCVIFCEDIDRVATGDRTIGLDELLNVVDGIESKAAELIVVLSTNDLDSIHEAMLRPGRIDGVITFREPDAKATEKLLRVYLGDLLDADEDISEASALLAGNKTAAVREAATRVKAAAIWTTGEVPTKVTAEDLRQAAMSVVNQMNALIRDPKEKHSEIVKAARVLADGLALATPNIQAMASEAFLASTNPFTEHPNNNGGERSEGESWEKRLTTEGRRPDETIGALVSEVSPPKE